ncbi:S8 family serine peptidase [Patescibacteria group bacterium]
MKKVNKKLYFIFFFAFIFFNINSAYSLEPNDQGYYMQWYLNQAHAPEAWEKTTGNSDIVIAFLDSGVDLDHPDLKNNIWKNLDEIAGDGIDNDFNGYVDDINGWDFVDSDNDPNPKIEENFFNADGSISPERYAIINHGTLMAGVAAARGDNMEGIAGVAWNVKIMPLKIDEAINRATEDIILKAVQYAIDNGADILNLSFEVSHTDKFKELLEEAYNKGIIIVAATGNDNKFPKYPVCYLGDNNENIILGVAGTDKNDNVIREYGYECADIAAPAVDFFSTSVFDSNYEGFESYYSGFWPGTSFATALVSGSAALVKDAMPHLNNKSIYDLIIAKSDHIDGEQEFGRINIAKILGIIPDENSIFKTYLLITPSANIEKKSEIRRFKNDSIFINSFLPYEDDYLYGVKIAYGNVDNDEYFEILVSKSKGDLPQVRIFDEQGFMESEFLAYNINFKGGVNIASGDIDEDGIDEVITGAGQGGGPHIKIFDKYGNVKGQFFAYSKDFRGGVNVSSGDIDGDGIDEVITGAGQGGGPHIRIFDKYGNVKGQFFAYSKDFRGGVNVSSGDIDGDGIDEIITGAGQGGGPHIRIFDKYGNVKGNFFAYSKDFRGGVNVSSGDIDEDGIDEIITGAGPGGNPDVRIFDVYGNKKIGFFAFDENFRGGVNVGLIKVIE